MKALYFPHLSLPASCWVNPALLYFDQIGLISPRDGELSIYDQRTRQLMDLNLVYPEVPSRYWGLEEDDRFYEYVRKMALTKKRTTSIARLHIGKLYYMPSIRKLLTTEHLAQADNMWIEGPDWLIDHIMAFLALQISIHSRDALPIVTDAKAGAKMIAGTSSAHIQHRRLRALSRLLPAPPDARPDDIAQFRLTHNNEIKQFRDYVNNLVALDAFDELGERRFNDRLSDALHLRDHLIGEMECFGWRAQGLTLSIAAFSAAAPYLEHAPWSFGAGLLGAFCVGRKALSAWRRRLIAAGNPIMYATNVVRHWPTRLENTLHAD